MTTKSFRVQLKDGQEFEVASEADAKKFHADGKIVSVTAWDKDGVMSVESYRGAGRAASAEKTETPAPAEKKDE